MGKYVMGLEGWKAMIVYGYGVLAWYEWCECDDLEVMLNEFGYGKYERYEMS